MQYVAVSQHFLNKNQYVKNFQQLLRRQQLCDQFLEYLINVYACFHPLTNFVNQPSDQVYQSVFKSFRLVILSYVKQFGEVSSFYEAEVVKQKCRKIEDLNGTFDNLLNELQRFGVQQRQHKQDLRMVKQKVEKIKKEVTRVKETKDDLLNYYNPSYTFNYYAHFVNEFNALMVNAKILSSNNEKIFLIQSNFINEVYNFRKSLVNSRYVILDRFKNTCSETKTGFCTLFAILLQNIRRGISNFKKQTSQWNYLKGSKVRGSNIQSSINESKVAQSFIMNINRITSDYNRRLNDLLRFIKDFSNSLDEIVEHFKAVNEKYKKMMLSSIANAFQTNQSPLLWVKSACQIIENCLSKIADIANRLKEIQMQLQTLAQKLKRHIEISISLLQNPKGEIKGSKIQNQSFTNQISYHTGELQKQINSTELEEILIKILVTIEEKMLETNNWLEMTIVKKKKQVDYSMDISMVTELDEVYFQRENTREEAWLWADWKDPNREILNFISLKETVETLKEAPPPPDTNPAIQNYNCSLNNILHKGSLAIRNNDILFKSNNGNFTLKIPFQDIQKVENKMKFLVGEMMHVRTSKGEIVFSQFSQGIGKCKQLIKQNISDSDAAPEAATEEAATPQPKKKKYVLDNAELAAIETRLAKIKPQLKDKAGMMTIVELMTVNDITIQEFYEQIYSDSQKVIKGKRYECPMLYFLNATGNVKVKAIKYKNPGPAYYTGAEGVTFHNCPLFSERQIEYDHELPKLPIPFMPKYVHLKHVQKLYWVSHEQFHFYLESYGTGAPMADCFVPRLLVMVKKSGNNVTYEQYGQIKFVKSTSFKGILAEKGESEMRAGSKENIKMYLQRLEQYKKSGGNQDDKPEEIVVEAQPEKEQAGVDLKSELQAMRKQKNIILAAAVVILVFSILTRIL